MTDVDFMLILRSATIARVFRAFGMTGSVPIAYDTLYK